jgi:tRNA (guanine9-N1)-methyltransferase
MAQEERASEQEGVAVAVAAAGGEGAFICPVTGNAGTRTRSAKESVVYLTADSDVELLELSPEETYIIGGIVDKNRYKVNLLSSHSISYEPDPRQALCENKARSQTIRTARLPIGIYLKELPTRKVLTVNQVVDILLNWVEHRDWKKALFDVMPQRKFETVSKKARREQKRIQGDEGDAEMKEGTLAMDESGGPTHDLRPDIVDDPKVNAS